MQTDAFIICTGHFVNTQMPAACTYLYPWRFYVFTLVRVYVCVCTDVLPWKDLNIILLAFLRVTELYVLI